MRIKKAIHLKDEPPQAIKRRENGGFLAYVVKYHPGAGIVKKKVLHSGNLMVGPTVMFPKIFYLAVAVQIRHRSPFRR
jgi:hypothetical protein